MPTIVSTQLIIGMEIHVELATRSKMFTRAPNVAHPDHYDAQPNSLVDPLVLALPGALPVMNREAIEMSMLVGLALRCTIAERSVWDRKNYFYPDLPKGYQISQYDQPLCFDGALDVPLADGETHRVGIVRAHLEEDAGKLGHELPGGHHYDGSLVDLNRAGTPLLEIVTAPDLRNADEAEAFARELRLICRHLGVTEGIMQRGHMRFEPNINVVIETDDGRSIATPIVEVKNLNSFRALRGAIEYEAVRQIDEWREHGHEMGPGMKTTRGWDDETCTTFLQRGKEDAHDYRYFPDPDLLPVEIDPAWPERLREHVGELPSERRARYVECGVSVKDATAITEEPTLTRFFESCVTTIAPEIGEPEGAREMAKWLLNAGSRVANERCVTIDAIGITPQQLAELVMLRRAGDVGSTAADTLFERLCEIDEENVRALAEREGLLQVRDDAALDEWIAQAIARQPEAAEDFAAGKDAAIGRLIGEVMKLSGGSADAKGVRQGMIRVLRGS